MTIAFICLTVGIIGFSWPLFLYPFVLLFFSKRPLSFSQKKPSQVSVIVPCYNEEKSLKYKIDELLKLGQDLHIQIIIANDGSTDETSQVADVLAQQYPFITHLQLPRQGKGVAINAAWNIATAPIVIITDANSRLDSDSLSALLEPFQDPTVGAVRGRFLPLFSTVSEGTSEYQAINHRLFEIESAKDMLQVSGGVLQAFLREAHDPHQAMTMTEDWDMTLEARAQGLRVVYAPTAIGRKKVTLRNDELWQQQVRLIYGTIQTGWKWRSFLNVFRHGRQSLAFASGKLAQIFGPFYLLLFFLAFWLTRSTTIGKIGVWLIASIVVLAGTSVMVHFRSARFRPSLLAALEYLAVSEVAAVWALVLIIVRRGKNWIGWKPLQSVR